MSLPSLPAFPSLKTHHSIQPTLPSKFGATAATKTVALANSAVDPEATRIGKVWPIVDSENGVVGEKNIGIDDMRRKRRRKRRKKLGCVMEELNLQNNFLRQKLVDGSVRPGVLSSAEEVELCLCLKEAARIKVSNQTITELGGHYAVSRRFANACISKEILVLNFRGFVTSIAGRYKGQGLSMEDLIQEGIIGLFQAAERFDPKKGCRLSTYAFWWIRNAIKIALAKNSRLIRLPAKYKENAEENKVSRGQLISISYAEIAAAVGMDVSIVESYLEGLREPISLHMTITRQSNIKLIDIIPEPVEMNAEKMVEREIVKKELVRVLSTLKKREEEVVRLHYGLNGQTRHNYAEIGELLKLSRERIRQIHAAALSKLKETTLVDMVKGLGYPI